MDGSAFLAEVRRRFPSVVRIVLSGETNLGREARGVVEAHQFLAKPCEADRLEAAVERSLVLRLLTRKLGTLPTSVEARVEALDLSQLEALGEALLDFAQWSDLTDWLQVNS